MLTFKGQEGKKVKSTLFNVKYKKSESQNNENVNVNENVRREVNHNRDSLRDKNYNDKNNDYDGDTEITKIQYFKKQMDGLTNQNKNIDKDLDENTQSLINNGVSEGLNKNY